jgi:hypothetical protein
MSRRLNFWLIIALQMLCIAQKAARFSTLDPDAFWHLNVARQLHRDGIRPLVDDISYMSIRTPWTPYSWLAEMGMKAAWDIGGLRGAIVAQALVGAIVIAFVALACLQMTERPPQSSRYMPAVVGTFLACIWMLVFLAFRPVTLAIAILAACAWLLLRDRRLGERSRAVWLIVPLTALLVNVHVFVILVPAWIAALLVGAIVERKSIRRYAVMLILSLATFACTPMLRGMIDAIAHLPVSDPMTAARQQQELQTLWSEPYGTFIAITAGLSLVWIVHKRKLLRAGEWIWLIGMTIPLVRYGRLAPFFAVIAAPMTARTLPGPSDRMLDRSIIALVCVFALGLGLWQTVAALPRAANNPSIWLNHLGPNAQGYPCAAADYVEQHIAPRSGHLINEMNEGGYLGWRLYPKWQIFVDGRTPIYPPDVWRTYMGSIADVKRLLAPVDADAAILPIRKSRLRAALSELGWTSVYRDERAEVLLPPAR